MKDKTSTSAELAARLAQLASQFLGSLSESDVKALLAGEKIISLAQGRTSDRGNEDTVSFPGQQNQLFRDLAGSLARCKTREEARTLLNQPSVSRKILIGVCKISDIRSTKLDSKEDLIERLVESCVGFRLRSQAIRS